MKNLFIILIACILSTSFLTSCTHNTVSSDDELYNQTHATGDDDGKPITQNPPPPGTTINP